MLDKLYKLIGKYVIILILAEIVINTVKIKLLRMVIKNHCLWTFLFCHLFSEV